MSSPSVARIDAFTNAAFAFAVTLLVVGSGGEVDALALRRVVASIPAFAIGFAIIAMFWLAHVRWRRFRGDGDWRSLLLTLALVFVTLVYVAPLRAMAASFAAFLGASDGPRFAGELGSLFAIYGSGFVAMSLIIALLFRDVLPARACAKGARRRQRRRLDLGDPDRDRPPVGGPRNVARYGAVRAPALHDHAAVDRAVRVALGLGRSGKRHRLNRFALTPDMLAPDDVETAGDD